MKTSRGPHRVSLPRALSKLGYASRAQAFFLIREGRVAVNGRIVTNPHAWVQLNKDTIALEGKEVFQKEFRYLVFHKPAGVTTTRSDERGNTTVYDLLGETARGLSPVGRLDKDTSGLLLFTNDHQLANALTDPDLGIPKTYHVVLHSSPSSLDIQRLSKGVTITVDGKPYKTKPALVTKRSAREVEITIHEGKNRQLRKMFAALGYDVNSLQRTHIGPLSLGTLKEGKSRPLTEEEVRQLRTVLKKSSPTTR
ncbi:MAG TPA: pseudouridine synthase [Bacteroidota bacterium]|nr:pseudouridine synthase [Bacteroidota bacterium]